MQTNGGKGVASELARALLGYRILYTHALKTCKLFIIFIDLCNSYTCISPTSFQIPVVISGPFIKNLLHNHLITK